MQAVIVFVAGLVVSFCMLSGDGSPDRSNLPRRSLPTVPKLNLTKYLGRWYQMYLNPFEEITYERNGYCGTADYAMFPNGSISVRNTQRIKGPSGKVDLITGFAVRSDPKVEAQLELHLAGVPFTGTYWVVLLGPDTYGPDMKYQFSVVTDKRTETLFVLARNVAGFKTVYDTAMLQNLTKLGFDHFYNKPVAMYQESDCQYT